VPLTTHDKVIANLSGQYRKRLRKDRRAVEGLGERLHVQVVEDAEGFNAAFDTLARLHQERWTARGEPGSFSSDKFMRFHRAAAPKMMAQGWAKLWILHLDGEPLGALYDLVYAGKIFYYQSGMSAKKGVPILSPGLLLRDIGLENAIQMGLTECDFSQR
jgi:CelD/BcsL family acetyltransferase involved in cellulose biosynthesis